MSILEFLMNLYVIKFFLLNFYLINAFVIKFLFHTILSFMRNSSEIFEIPSDFPMLILITFHDFLRSGFI